MTARKKKRGFAFFLKKSEAVRQRFSEKHDTGAQKSKILVCIVKTPDINRLIPTSTIVCNFSPSGITQKATFQSRNRPYLYCKRLLSVAQKVSVYNTKGGILRHKKHASILQRTQKCFKNGMEACPGFLFQRFQRTFLIC